MKTLNSLKKDISFIPIDVLFTSQSLRSARMASPKIALHFRVCLFVCASTLITRAIYYVIRYYATAHAAVYISSFWRFVGQTIANEVLPRW